MIPYDAYPQNVEQWFQIMHDSPFKALFYLNSLDIISISMLGIMFIALYYMLKDKCKAWVAVFLPFAFLGIAVFVVPRSQLMNMVSLANKYFAASTPGEAARYLAAGEALSAVGLATFDTAGFAIIAFASLLASIALIYSKEGVAAGVIGILGFVLTVINDITLILNPEVSAVMLIISGAFWVVWWVMMSVKLFSSAKKLKHEPRSY
jgi:hypothetical protein